MIELRELVLPDGKYQLQYRYRAPMITDAIDTYPLEWQWSEWIAVKVEPSGGA